jgi:site-specific recombinase XerD
LKTRKVNWKEPELKKWLDNISNEGTRSLYQLAFTRYTTFTGLSAARMVDEAEKDARLPVRRKKDVVQHRILGFYKWLKEEWAVNTRGRGEQKLRRRGMTDNSALTLVHAVRSFYSEFGFGLKMKGKSRLPKPKVENKRARLNALQVKTLVDNARTLRDKAVILTMFQTGMDASTLCGVTYGQIAGHLKANDPSPWKLSLHRPKTGVDYETFMGKDSIEAVKTYIRDMERRGVIFDGSTQLFLKERGKQGLETNLVQNMMRDIAIRAGYLGENEKERINPVSPHALRESFGSLMLNSGVTDTVVDFWLGHAVGEMSHAYKELQAESVQKMYEQREHLLSSSDQGLTQEKLEQVKEEVKNEAKDWYGHFAEENVKLRSTLIDTKGQVEKLDGKWEQKFTQLTALLEQILPMTDSPTEAGSKQFLLEEIKKLGSSKETA